MTDFEKYIKLPLKDIVPIEHHKKIDDMFYELSGLKFYIPEKKTKSIIEFKNDLLKKGVSKKDIAIQISHTFKISSIHYIIHRYLKDD